MSLCLALREHDTLIPRKMCLFTVNLPVVRKENGQANWITTWQNTVEALIQCLKHASTGSKINRKIVNHITNELTFIERVPVCIQFQCNLSMSLYRWTSCVSCQSYRTTSLRPCYDFKVYIHI